jgi:hypothetical protein
MFEFLKNLLFVSKTDITKSQNNEMHNNLNNISIITGPKLNDYCKANSKPVVTKKGSCNLF